VWAVNAYREALATGERLCLTLHAPLLSCSRGLQGMAGQQRRLCCTSALPPPYLPMPLPPCASPPARPAVDQNKGHVRADKLQQLHTMHNLADLLGSDGRWAC